MEFFESALGTALLAIAVAAVTSGLVLGLLRIGPDRRKIGSEANLSDANAASLLTGSALEMVESAQREATAARSEAHAARQSADRAWRRVRVLERAMSDAHVPVPPDDAPDPTNGIALPPHQIRG